MQNLIFDVSANPVAAQTYKEYLGGVDWVLTSEVVIAGIVIVMLVLILLILIFKGFYEPIDKIIHISAFTFWLTKLLSGLQLCPYLGLHVINAYGIFI